MNYANVLADTAEPEMLAIITVGPNILGGLLYLLSAILVLIKKVEKAIILNIFSLLFLSILGVPMVFVEQFSSQAYQSERVTPGSGSLFFSVIKFVSLKNLFLIQFRFHS